MSEGLLGMNGDETVVQVFPVPRADPELNAIAAAYAEARSRDTALEVRLKHAHIRELVWAGIIVMLSVLVVWFFVARTQVHAFVQVVQVDEDKKVYLLGKPQDLLSYTPPEGIWLDMLGEWVRKVRWRGTEPEQGREAWRWAYYHTCKDARVELQNREESDKPFDLGPGKPRIAVELQSITKSDIPKAYNVLWKETVTENYQKPRPTYWSGLFSVGRTPLPTLETAIYNRLGLCVSGFDISPMTKGVAQ